MGVIEDGTATGHLPNSKVFAIHYPAYPSSMFRAIETLGGHDAIAKVRTSEPNKLEGRTSESNKLELRFRPEDPFSHPAFGEPKPCNNLLLKIFRRKSTSSKNDNISTGQSKESSSTSSLAQTDKGSPSSTSTIATQTTEDSIVVCADIVARVQEAYHFNGMVDYQHVVAVHGDVARRKRGKWAEVKEPLETGDIGNQDDENLMMLAPPLFSLKHDPENLVLRPSAIMSSKKEQERVVQHRWEMDIEPCLAIDFTIKEIPTKINWKDNIPQETYHWKWQIAVSSFFDERPIWPRASISERLANIGLKCGDHVLKRLLFRTAYYFGSGPFHRFWIRKGYDPRKDPESRMYQRIDFRVPPPLRGYCIAASGRKRKWEDLCNFRVFPHKCQTYFQLFELADDYVQQEIRKPPHHTVCTSSTGWFSSYTLDSLRLCVKLRFLSVYPEHGAESWMKSVSERFEKSKKIRFHVNLKPVEDGESQVNQELASEEDKAEEEEEENEENESEDEEVEEVGEDADFPTQSPSYLGGENSSRNLLQGLFEKFPSTEGSFGELQDADSEGEYQIYEEHSDNGNNSDED